jgi:hypothetical protein
LKKEGKKKMAKRYTLPSFLLFTVTALIMGASGHTAEKNKAASEMQTQPANIIIMYPLGESQTSIIMKELTHEGHVKEHKVKCNVCHHVYENGENVWKEGMPIKKCEGCHDETAVKGKKELIPGIQIKKLITQEKVCRDCHAPKYGWLLSRS